jgi:hypothetical protein
MSEDEEKFLKLLALAEQDAEILRRLTLGVDDPELLERAAAQRITSEVRDAEEFFEEDEPVEDVIAAFEAGEQGVTQDPAHGTGWCAPSP